MPRGVWTECGRVGGIEEENETKIFVFQRLQARLGEKGPLPWEVPPLPGPREAGEWRGRSPDTVGNLGPS